MNSNPSNTDKESIEAALAMEQGANHRVRKVNQDPSSTVAEPPLALPDHSLVDTDDEDDDDNSKEAADESKNTTIEPKPSSIRDEVAPSELKGGNDEADTQVVKATRIHDAATLTFVPDSSPLLESFVQQATRVQSLVLGALQSRRIKRVREAGNDDDAEQEEPTSQRRRVSDSDSLVSDMLREKTNQVMTLERQVQAIQTELSSLKSTNDNLRSEAETNQKRYERTAEALRLAQRNASQARMDADEAETTAANLAQTLQSLQAVIRETQNETRHLQEAHDEIQQKSTAVQADLWQKDVRIACLEKEHNSLLAEYQTLERAQKSWKQEKKNLEQIVEEKEQQLGTKERQWHERRTMDEARQQRVQRLEEDWKKAESLLFEATTAQAGAAETQSQLRSDLLKLQQKNQEMHEQLSTAQEKARRDNERHTKELQEAEQNGNQWHIQLETCQDQNERLRLEKTNLEKQISKLKSQLANKATADSQSVAPSVSPDGEKTGTFDHDFVTKIASAKTPETNRNKENSTNSVRRASIVPQGACSLCGKPGFGLMKKCQCGNCDERAHLSCLHRSGMRKAVDLSVSHPGTPAPRASFILCGAATPQAPESV